MTLWKRLEDLCEVAQGAPLSRLRSDTGQKFKIIQIADLDRLGPNTELDEERLIPDSTPTVPPGSVLMTLRGSPIRAAVLHTGMVGHVASPNLAVLTLKRGEGDWCKDAEEDAQYLAGLLGSALMRQPLETASSGSAVTTLSVRGLRSVEVPVPSRYMRGTFAAAFKAQRQMQLSAENLLTLQAERLDAELDLHLGGERA